MWTILRRLASVAVCLVPLVCGAGDPVTGRPRKVQSKSGVDMVWLPGGWFTMGDQNGEVDEHPHKVHLKPFTIDVHPVTQKAYRKVMGKSPARWRRLDNPVEQVRWSDAVRYCNERSKREGLKACYDP